MYLVIQSSQFHIALNGKSNPIETIRESGSPAESPDRGGGRKCVRERRVAPRVALRHGLSDKKEWNRDLSPLVLMEVQGRFLITNYELQIINYGEV